MTTYNVYIARGERFGIAVMKIGKSQNLPHRERVIGLSIELSVPQFNEHSAFVVERNLKKLIIAQGGKRIPNTRDSFHYDPEIYSLLHARIVDLTEKASEEEEIRDIRTSYYAILRKEIERNKELPEVKQLRAKAERLQTVNENLNAEFRSFQTTLIQLQEFNKHFVIKGTNTEALIRERDELRRELGKPKEEYSYDFEEPYLREIRKLRWKLDLLEEALKFPKESAAHA
jgi:hypothetical protein